MRVLTSKDSDFSSYFREINEDNIDNTTLKKILLDNLTNQGNKGKKFGQLPLEYIFGFCNTF